jgi:hypothetical protein
MAALVQLTRKFAPSDNSCTMTRGRPRLLGQALFFLLFIVGYFGIEKWVEERRHPSKISVKAHAGEPVTLHFSRPIVYSGSETVVDSITAGLKFNPMPLPRGLALESHTVIFYSKSAFGDVTFQIPQTAAGAVRFEMTAIANARRNYAEPTMLRSKPVTIEIEIE